MHLKFLSPARLLPGLQPQPSILMNISTCPKTELLISPTPSPLGLPWPAHKWIFILWSGKKKKKKSLHLFLMLPYYLCPSSNSIFSVRPLKYMGSCSLSSAPCLPPRLTGKTAGGSSRSLPCHPSSSHCSPCSSQNALLKANDNSCYSFD